MVSGVVKVPKYPGDKVVSSVRLQETEELLAMAVPTTQIAEKLSKRHNVSIRSAHNWIRRVREQWARDAEENGEYEKRRLRHIRTAEILMQKAIASKDLNAAHRFFRTLLEIDGFVGPARINVNIGSHEHVHGVLVVQPGVDDVAEWKSANGKPVIDVGGSDE